MPGEEWAAIETIRADQKRLESRVSTLEALLSTQGVPVPAQVAPRVQPARQPPSVRHLQRHAALPPVPTIVPRNGTAHRPPSPVVAPSSGAPAPAAGAAPTVSADGLGAVLGAALGSPDRVLQAFMSLLTSPDAAQRLDHLASAVAGAVLPALGSALSGLLPPEPAEGSAEPEGVPPVPPIVVPSPVEAAIGAELGYPPGSVVAFTQTEVTHQ
jgi:hypothetical protein